MHSCTETFEKASLRAGFFYELLLIVYTPIPHQPET
jgi:hypothetical protein